MNSYESKFRMSGLGLSVEQGVLALGMAKDNPATVLGYRNEGGRMKAPDQLSITEHGSLVEKFSRNPKQVLAYGRENMFAIAQDQNITPEQRNERFGRYLKAYLEMQLKLDRAAFPPDPSTIKNGVPDYIPDGLSDMGSDNELDATRRSREKIRIDKRQIFGQARELFEKVFQSDTGKMSLERRKKFIVECINYHVFTKMPYDYQNRGPINPNKSIPLHKVAEDRQAVCRHHALYTQVLLQAFGISSKLLKCELDFGNGNKEPHVANLVRINGKWYLMDVTNPDENNGIGEYFIRELPETDIDTNRQTYTWRLNRKKEGKNWVYVSRNNMYFRINDNQVK